MLTLVYSKILKSITNILNKAEVYLSLLKSYFFYLRLIGIQFIQLTNLNMAIYVSSHCPHCNSKIESYKRTGINDFESSIGNPLALCPYCYKVYDSKKKYWSEHNIGDKIIRIIQLIITIFLGTFATGLILFVIVGSISLFFISNEVLNENLSCFFRMKNNYFNILTVGILLLSINTFKLVKHFVKLTQSK